MGNNLFACTGYTIFTERHQSKSSLWSSGLATALRALLVVALSGLLGCATVDTTKDIIANAHYRSSIQRHAIPLSEENARSYAVLAVPFAHISAHVYCKYLNLR